MTLVDSEHHQDDHHDGGGGVVDGRLEPREEVTINFDDRNVKKVTEYIFRDLQTVLPTDTADVQQDGVEVHVRRDGQAGRR